MRYLDTLQWCFWVSHCDFSAKGEQMVIIELALGSWLRKEYGLFIGIEKMIVLQLYTTSKSSRGRTTTSPI